jgi:FkbM family methyltransferase
MKIFYGILNNRIDVTDICLEQLQKNNVITIPAYDGPRSKYFTDPIFGTLKKVFVLIGDEPLKEYDDYYTVFINLVDNTVTAKNDKQAMKRLENIQTKLKIKHGSFNEELPEQKMTIRNLVGNEKVLEIGGNIGRNTLVIASILGKHNEKNLVTLESNSSISKQLKENRDANNFKFHIENSALSKRKLIQKGWDTKPSEVLLDGHKWVNITSFEELQTKYNIVFDTLVLDCEGAFYYILMDMPEILDNIKLIIMENDYYDIKHKKYVDDVLTKNGFYNSYSEKGGWGVCYDNFFQVWKK